MMRGASRFAGVVTTRSVFLCAITGHDRGVEIQRQAINAQLAKLPRIEGVGNTLIIGLRELTEQAHDRFEIRHLLKSKQPLQYRVMTGDFSMFEAIGNTPDGKHELYDELLRPITSIAAWLRSFDKL